MPHVIALVDDLMALSRIREAARAAGAEVRAARRAEEAAALVREGARLVLVDAEASRLPWPEAVAAVRRDGPADLPIVAFFSHVHAERAAAARAAGCTRVIARSAFALELPTLVAAAAAPPAPEETFP
jgi:CheY-like chemotaxis protein